MLKKQIREFNKKYYDELLNMSNDFILKKDMNIIHHIWRVVLQFKMADKVKGICDLIIKKQYDNGMWGDSYIEDNFGTTVVTIHRLLWSLKIIDNSFDTKDIRNSISRAMNFIIPRHEIVFMENIVPNHGIIDRLHHLIQVEYYIVNFNDKYNFVSEDESKKLNEFLLNDQKWLIDNQCKDGGWHEVDRVRSRIGTTADALRGIILDDSYIESVERGIEFLINNQNIYHGYWMAGNVDKMSDAIKGLLNSVNLIKNINLKNDCIECIKKGIKWLYNNYQNMENLEENEYDLLTITIDFENIIFDNKMTSFI